MKLVKPSFEIWEELPFEEAVDNGVHVKWLADKALGEQPSREALTQAVYRQIEKVGRVCYKSEDKITEDSAKPFVDRMIKSGHGAMLEHGTVYMFIPIGCDKHDYHVAQKYHNNKYSKVIIRNEHFLLNKNGYYITTNLRVLIENEWMDDLKYICDLTEFHEKRITVHFVCNRQVSHEYVRHKLLCVA